MELFKKYRPTSLDQLVGQEAAVKVLEGMIKSKRIPHAVLLTGPSGCGKTTIARILKDHLNCRDNDFQEINTADFRGVDKVRDIRATMSLAALGGCRIYYLDECFHPDTLVDVPFNKKRIGDIRVGDTVIGIDGEKEVEKVFRNRVPLERVCWVSLSNGNMICCSLDHEFLTDRGWVRAKDLEGARILSEVRYPMCTGGTNYEDTNVLLLSERVPAATQEPTEVLFQELRSEASSGVSGERTVGEAGVSGVRQVVQGTKVKSEEILQQIVSGQKQSQETRDSKGFVQPAGGEEDQQLPSTVQHLRARESASYGSFRTDAGEQPHVQTRDYRKDGRDQNGERYTPPVEGGAGWERDGDDRTATEAVGDTGSGMGGGTPNQNRERETHHRTSNSLQTRPVSTIHQTSSGDRWDWPQVEKEYLARCKKNQNTRSTRVDRIEVYQPGSNDGVFASVVSNQERSQGFVEFIDLQVSGHPSYFAGGVPVHNCHGLSKDAQNAMLKMLEDTPNHVYFLLATTDPNKLLPTIRTRCTLITVQPLSRQSLLKLVQGVAKKERLKVGEEALEKLVELADGSARKALVMLNSIVDVTDPDEQLDCIQKTDSAKAAIDLARALINPRGSWPEVSKLVKGIEEEPETVRRMILSFMSSVILGDGKPDTKDRAFQVIQIFRDHWYDCGKAGLVASCYEMYRK